MNLTWVSPPQPKSLRENHSGGEGREEREESVTTEWPGAESLQYNPTIRSVKTDTFSLTQSRQYNTDRSDCYDRSNKDMWNSQLEDLL